MFDRQRQVCQQITEMKMPISVKFCGWMRRLPETIRLVLGTDDHGTWII